MAIINTGTEKETITYLRLEKVSAVGTEAGSSLKRKDSLSRELS